MIVCLNSTLRGQSGMHVLEVDLPVGASVRRVLIQAIADYPVLQSILTGDRGEIRGDLAIFRNGRNIRFQAGLDTVLAAHDKLDLFPPTGAQRAFAAEPHL